jgi:ATP-dependent Clp protease protease subunit
VGPGSAARHAFRAKEIVRLLRAEMEAIMARHTRQSIEKLREDTARDLVMNAEEAVTCGLVDGVLESWKLAPAS